MIKLLKILGFRKCFLCGKIVFIKRMYWQRFSDSPDEEIGYKALICKSCDYWCEENSRG